MTTELEYACLVADFQLAHMDGALIREQNDNTMEPARWQIASFYKALATLNWYVEDRYRNALDSYADLIGVKLNGDIYHADLQVAGYALLAIGRGDQVKSQLRLVVDNPSTASLDWKDADRQQRWSWVDALFMAPPTWHLARNAGLDTFAAAEVRATIDYLYDPAAKLFYRDSRFKGKGVFWGRGNGWAIAGLADCKRYVSRDFMIDFATGLIDRQSPDGSWSADLQLGGVGEMSATGLITSGLAQMGWTPEAVKGLTAIRERTDADGRVTFVQQIGDKPVDPEPTDTQFYGSAAAILAAVNVWLDRGRS